MRLAEQNRNQLTFGAGVSQYEGVFGQLAFQTSNFLGRGESLTLQMTAGDRSQNYQLAFTEPYLFDRNITGGLRLLQAVARLHRLLHAEVGWWEPDLRRSPWRISAGMFFSYAYESVKIENLNEALIDQSCLFRATGCGDHRVGGRPVTLTQTQREILSRNPFVLESLLLGQGGSRTISKVVPSFVHNTVDNPIFPNEGKKLTATIDLALLGGNTKYYKPRVEAIFFKRHLVADVGRLPRAGRIHLARLATVPASRNRSQTVRAESADLRAPDPGRRIQHPRLRSCGRSDRPCPDRSPCSAATRACSSTPNISISIASQVRFVFFLRRRPGARCRTGVRVERGCDRAGVSAAPPLIDALAFSSLDAARCAGRDDEGDRPGQRVQDVDGRRAAVLHAGPERAVPVDLLV